MKALESSFYISSFIWAEIILINAYSLADLYYSGALIFKDDRIAGTL